MNNEILRKMAYALVLILSFCEISVSAGNLPIKCEDEDEQIPSEFPGLQEEPFEMIYTAKIKYFPGTEIDNYYVKEIPVPIIFYPDSTVKMANFFIEESKNAYKWIRGKLVDGNDAIIFFPPGIYYEVTTDRLYDPETSHHQATELTNIYSYTLLAEKVVTIPERNNLIEFRTYYGPIKFSGLSKGALKMEVEEMIKQNGERVSGVGVMDGVRIIEWHGLYREYFMEYMEIEKRGSKFIPFTLYLKREVGIDEMETEAADTGSVYDLMGRKMPTSNLQPGIYIRNGHKFVVK